MRFQELTDEQTVDMVSSENNIMLKPPFMVETWYLQAKDIKRVSQLAAQILRNGDDHLPFRGRYNIGVRLLYVIAINILGAKAFYY